MNFSKIFHFFLAKFFSFFSSKSNLLKSILLFHIGPDHGGPGHKVGQHSSAAEAVPMTLTVCLMTGNGLAVRDCGGESIHATAALGKIDSTASDATKNQLDPLMNVEGKAKLIIIYL